MEKTSQAVPIRMIASRASGDAEAALHGLLRRVTSCEAKAGALEAVADLLLSQHPNSTLLYLERESNGKLGAPRCLNIDQQGCPPVIDSRHVQSWSEQACAAGHPQWRRFAGATPLRGVAAPVYFRGQPPEALCWLIRDTGTPVEQLELAILHATAHVTLWQLARQPLSPMNAAPAADRLANDSLSQALAAAQGASSLEQAMRELAAALAKQTSCQRVALGVVHGASCRLTVVSDQAIVDRRSELAETIEKALDEALDAERPLLWPDKAATPQNLRQAAALAGVKSAIAVALRDVHQKPIAAALLFDPPQDSEGRPIFGSIQPSLPLLASSVGLLIAAHQSIGTRLKARAAHISRQRGSLIALLVATAALSLLFVPVPYRLTCDSVLEPVSRRFVAAPFAGRLEAAFVQPGDLVQAGQALARMNEEDLALELAAVDAEWEQARKKADAALASRNAAAAQVAQLEARQLEVKRQTLKSRRERLTIVSPVQGMVVRGDLKRSEGAPVSVGQALFEVAPLDAMVVEIALPEEEAAHFKAGCSARLSLNAFAGRSWSGALERIHPRAELRDDHQVFIGEMPLTNADGALRPGLRGKTQLIGPKRSLGWIWLHRPWEALRRAWRW